ncbi:hypothetical protein EDD11_007727 [Mortierella claussenii]|nr:hypothetical protein EDD11_007727 [Mortierella claussenii]
MTGVTIDKSEVLIRPFTPEDNDQVISILLAGYNSMNRPIFLRKVKQYKTLFSILSKSVVYTCLIELGLTAYANTRLNQTTSTSASPSFAGVSLEDLRSFSDILFKPESAQSLILQFLQPSFILVWVIVTLIVAFTTIVATYRWSLAGNAHYIGGCLKDDLGNIQGYYQSTSSTQGEKNRSAFWVACLKTHPQVVMGCIGVDDSWAHREHIRKKYVAERGSEESFELPKETEAELRRLAVHVNYRRLGISRMLLETLADHARKQGFRHVWLTTSYIQQPALAGYIRFGFDKVKAMLYADDLIRLWKGTLNLYATAEEKEAQKNKQPYLLKDVGLQ